MIRVFSSCWCLMGGDRFALAVVGRANVARIAVATDRCDVGRNLQLGRLAGRDAVRRNKSIQWKSDEGVSVARRELSC